MTSDLTAPSRRPASVQEKSGATATAPAPRVVYFKKADLTSVHLSQENAVLHLDGSVSDPSGMVVTTSDYVEHYRNERRGEENPILSFLENLFRTTHVPFIGLRPQRAAQALHRAVRR